VQLILPMAMLIVFFGLIVGHFWFYAARRRDMEE
jgi:hypothetical protein